MPGVGKSELALAVAQGLRATAWDHQLFVHLRGYDEELPPADPKAVLGTLLRHLGVPPAETQHLSLAARIAGVQAAIQGHTVLVLLDNAAGEAQVRPLLEALSGARVLVTSRQTLPVDLTDPVELDVLTTEESLALLARAAPGAPVGDDEATRRVIALCGHLPLHLTLTGARIAESPGWTMTDQVHRLESLPREDAVVPALSSSYRALEPGDAGVFRALALHPGDTITAEAAAALASVSVAEASASLQVLAHEHLVRLDSRGRARLHDLVRAYAGRLARDQDPQSARSAALRRLLASYRDAVTVAVGTIGWSGPTSAAADAQAARAWLAAETGNVTNAALAAVHHEAMDELVAIAEALMPWLEADARLAEAAALARAGVTSPVPRHRAVSARILSRVHDLTGEFDEALDRAREAVAAGGDRPQAAAVNQLGNVLVRLGRLEEAAASYADAVRLARDDADARGVGRFLGNLASVEYARGDLAAAVDHYRGALATSESVADLANVGTLCTNLADLHLAREELPDAGRMAARALEIDQAMGDRLHVSRHLTTLGDVASREGRHDEATELLDRALTAARTARAEVYQGETLVRLGDAAARRGDPGLAVRRYSEALEIGQRVGSPWIQADVRNGLGSACLALDERTVAREHFECARAIAEEMGEPSEVARADEGLGDCALADGDVATARARWHQALVHHDRAGTPAAGRLARRIADHAD